MPNEQVESHLLKVAASNLTLAAMIQRLIDEHKGKATGLGETTEALKLFDTFLQLLKN